MVVYRPRESFNLPPPVSNDGSPRPFLAPLRPTITCHYPGAPLGVSYVDMTSDFKKRTYIANMQRYAQAAGKSYEYNYVLFLDGEVWEYAGDYLAAHSAGENSIAYGVQFVNGQDDLATDAQVEAFRWLRDVHLKGRDRLAPNAATIPHRYMPGAVTACPGDRAVMPRLEELRQPWQPPEPAEEEDWKMADYLALLTDGRHVEKCGGVVRTVSKQELQPGGPLADEPVWAVPADSDATGFANYWLGKAADAYERSLG